MHAHTIPTLSHVAEGA